MIQRLYQAGFSIVGRYLTGSVGTGSAKKAKNLTSDEISKLTAAGFSIFLSMRTVGMKLVISLNHKELRIPSSICGSCARLSRRYRDLLCSGLRFTGWRHRGYGYCVLASRTSITN
nr:glycoside hydrolase domain-containing protein [Lactiplantibacillus pentosus]